MFLIKTEYNEKVNKVMKKIDNSNIKLTLLLTFNNWNDWKLNWGWLLKYLWYKK